MSKECKYFVQHAWKKELCANCFESRQEHQRTTPFTKPLIHREIKNVQGILRGRKTTTTTAVTGRRVKNNRVVFLEDLAQIIGYGGDDYSDSEEELDPSTNNIHLIESVNISSENEINDEEVDYGQDSEEAKALENLTRVNTNFNTVTANLMNSPTETKPKSLGLMLGRIQKDADGNKTTLLISVTPFGTDDVSMPTARRPIDRKRVVNEERPIALEKIVDMPLIASNNLMAIKKNDTPIGSTNQYGHGLETTRTKSLSINSASNTIKTTECQTANETIPKSEQSSDSPISDDNNQVLDNEPEDSISTEVNDIDPNIEDLGERTVEGESEPIEMKKNECGSLALEDNNSREEAGVPDGKADEDEVSMESSSIIPAEPRRSFLHSEALIATKKPMVFSKSVDEIREIDKTNDCSLKLKSSSSEDNFHGKIIDFVDVKEEDCSLDNQLSGNGKRRMAPKPPAEATLDETSVPLFSRKPNVKLNNKSDCPVVREKEKRERATTSSSPKLMKSLGPTISDETIALSSMGGIEGSPQSKRSISLSQQDIGLAAAMSDKFVEEKKKSKSRFSLKKLLRMGGSRKDMNLISPMTASTSKVEEIPGVSSQPKPRLEIIHPLQLDGAAVEVLRHDKLSKSQEEEEKVEHVANDSKPESTNNITVRLGKPPPPPRNGQSSTNFPSKPPPRPLPPTIENSSTKSSSIRSWHNQPGIVAGDSIYANLAAENVAGEVRSMMAPSKPQRTASIKRESEAIKCNQSSPREIAANRLHDKQSLEPPVNSDSLDSASSDSHDVYEFLSSSPECDSNLELRRHINEVARTNALKRNSENSIVTTDHYRQFKYNNKSTFSRSNSLPYCGSETESELSTVDGCYTGNEGPEEDQDWKAKNDNFSLNRIRQRRNRTVVHRSLEDNYGAVVIANHESLAQLLDRLSQVDHTPLSLHLRPLSTSNPRFNDFHIDLETIRTIGKRVFFSASWNEHQVTICLSSDGLSSPVSHKEFSLTPILEFVDKIPTEMPLTRFTTITKNNKDVTISVLPPYQVCSMKSYLSTLPRQHRNNNTSEHIMRECCLILLQFVTALKNLQARGIEELPKSLSNFVLCKEDRDPSYRLFHLQSLHVDHISDDEEHVSLCQSGLVALRELNLTNRLPVIRELLVRERAVSLSQVRAVLEYSLWGPADVTLGIWKEREIVLQRWLDLERATVLHALVRTRPPLIVADEYQLLFLVQTTSKNMCEASVLLDEQRSKLQTFQKIHD